jgi:deoxycytidylate deaminase
VVRLSSSGILHSAPCENCFSLIKRSGIKKIVFSDDNGGFEIHDVVEYQSFHVTTGFRHLPEDI